MSAATSARTRILASAGTGKTFRLTNHFIALLFAGEAPERILATTFTRKAAGEILERVLLRVADAATDAEALRGLAAATDTPDLDAARCMRELERIAWNLQRFQVRTLDSFFVRVATLFGLELGLPPGWSIAKEAEGEALRMEAVRRLLSDCEPEKLIELLRGLHARPASRDVHDTLLTLLGAGRIALLDSRPEAWDQLPVPKAPQEDLAPLLEAVATQPLPFKKGTEIELSSWRKAMDRMISRAQTEDWDGLLKDGLLAKILAGEDRFDRRPITTAMNDALEPILEHVIHAQLERLSRRNRSMAKLLAELDALYLELLRERGQLRFEDIPALLDPREGESPIAPADMWFRLDAHLDHLLLDEFQDTSATQWRVLEPLVSEIVAERDSGRSFFCVGDVKQCIYYWRQAEPRLLTEMDKLLPGLDEAETLVTNYRSAPVVLDAVNQVFGALTKQPFFEHAATAELQDAVARFQSAFEPHVANRDKMPGGVLLLEAPLASTANAAASDPLEVAATRICALLEKHPAASIGVLFRTNASLPRMMHLLAGRGLRASGEGGNLLSDSIAALHYLSLLTLADHPGHTMAAFAVATSPLGPVVGLDPTDCRNRVRLAALAAELCGRIAREGHGAFCASFMPTVEEQYGTWDAHRFAQLVELAEAWKEPSALRPGRFVAHVLATRVEDPTASNVQCMTIHAAKGLEFDAVFLPELGGPIVQTPRELLTHRARPDALLDAVSIKPIAAVAGTSPELQQLFRGARSRSLEEALSVLYVAMTRARHWLEMILPAVVKGQPAATAANLLREIFETGEAGRDHVLYRHPGTDEAGAWDCDARTEAPVPDQREPPTGLGLARATMPRHPPTRSPSGATAHSGAPSRGRGEGTRARNQEVRGLLGAPASEAMHHGTLVHRLMQEIVWLQEFDATDEALANVLAPFEADSAHRTRAITSFRAALAQPRIAELLDREGAKARDPKNAFFCEVVRERRFSTELFEPDGTSVLWNGAIDRLVLHHRAGQTTSADVIDWKSDAIAPEEADERSERYRPQMEAYRRVVAAQTGLPAESIRMLVVYLAVGCVSELQERREGSP